MSKQSGSISGDDAAKQLISMTEAAILSGFTTGYLRKLARREIIWATKKGRDWFTTEEEILEYLSTNRRPGPQPQE